MSVNDECICVLIATRLRWVSVRLARAVGQRWRCDLLFSLTRFLLPQLGVLLSDCPCQEFAMAILLPCQCCVWPDVGRTEVLAACNPPNVHAHTRTHTHTQYPEKSKPVTHRCNDLGPKLGFSFGFCLFEVVYGWLTDWCGRSISRSRLVHKHTYAHTKPSWLCFTITN